MHDEVYSFINKLWPNRCPVPTPQEALRGAKRLYRVAMGRPWRGDVKLTSGNRHTWIRRGVLYVNPDKRFGYRGWRDIVHSISHYAHMRKHPSAGPHDVRQAYLERDLANYVISHGWLEGHLKPKAPKEKPPRDIVRERYDRMLARCEAWSKKARRAEQALKKAKREISAYETRHGDRLK